MGIPDILMVVLIADAAQNAMSAEYRSVPDGLALVATIIFWDFALDWLGFRYPGFRRLVHPPPLLLVHDGRILRRNLRKEFITEEELRSQLREQGIDDLGKVKTAHMEGDGRISVVPWEAS